MHRNKLAPRSLFLIQGPAASARHPLLSEVASSRNCIGLAIWYLARLEPLLVQGEVESTCIDIAAQVSGRLVKVPVSRGQDVAAGTTLLVIDNPELVVQLHEAEAGKLVADAELARINVGTRSEIIAERTAEIDRAAADLTLAQQTYNRTKQLAAAKFGHQSKLDQDTSLVDLRDSWLGFSLRCDRGAG